MPYTAHSSSTCFFAFYLVSLTDMYGAARADGENNKKECGYDGGDCCVCDCKVSKTNTVVPATALEFGLCFRAGNEYQKNSVLVLLAGRTVVHLVGCPMEIHSQRRQTAPVSAVGVDYDCRVN